MWVLKILGGMDELVQASMIVTMSPVQALLLLLGAPPGLKMPAYDLVQAGMIVTMSLVQALLLLLGTPPGLKMPTIVTMSLVQAHASSTLSKSPLLDPGKKTKEATALTSPAQLLVSRALVLSKHTTHAESCGPIFESVRSRRVSILVLASFSALGGSRFWFSGPF